MKTIDLYSRIGLSVGIGLALQPWWSQGLRIGFFITLVATVLHLVTSHALVRSDDLP